MGAVATPPYCEPDDVALLLVNVLGPDKIHFDNLTTVNEAQVMNTATLVSSQIDSRLRAAGYVIPLVKFIDQDGTVEDWPVSQSNWLRLICALGTAGYVSGLALRPAPGGFNNRRDADNSLVALYRQELDRICDGQESTCGLRAKFYFNRPAHRALYIPHGIQSDYGYGKVDISSFSFETYTNFARNVGHLLECTYGVDWPYLSQQLQL